MTSPSTDKQIQRRQRRAEKREARKARKLQKRQGKSIDTQKAPAESLSRRDKVLLGIEREHKIFDLLDDEYWAQCDAHPDPPRRVPEKQSLAKQLSFQRAEDKRRKEARAKAREERDSYKRRRVRDLIDAGSTKAEFKERRDKYECMKNHPGRYCSSCHPRRDDPLLDEEREKEDYDGPYYLSDEKAELSESWSDNPNRDWTRSPSLTYSDLWADEEEKDEVTESIKRNIQRVDAAHSALKASLERDPSRTVKIGGLLGRWDLYNLEVCPKTSAQTNERYRLEFSKAAANHQVPSQDRSRVWGNSSFISWTFGMVTGNTVPFQIPKRIASLAPIPIVLFRAGKRHNIDIHAEIAFLGKSCLRLRVPRSVVYPNEIQSSNDSEPMIEFAGLRWTEQDEQRVRQAEEKANLKRQKEPSPRSPKWYDLDNGCPSEYEFQFY